MIVNTHTPENILAGVITSSPSHGAKRPATRKVLGSNVTAYLPLCKKLSATIYLAPPDDLPSLVLKACFADFSWSGSYLSGAAPARVSHEMTSACAYPHPAVYCVQE